MKGELFFVTVLILPRGILIKQENQSLFSFFNADAARPKIWPQSPWVGSPQWGIVGCLVPAPSEYLAWGQFPFSWSIMDLDPILSLRVSPQPPFSIW